MSQARITRVRLENYKSIKFCDVQLEPITVLVGQNGAGKSNFLDAILFLTDCARDSLQASIRNRGGQEAIIYKNEMGVQADFLSIEIWFQEPDESISTYELKIKFSGDGRSIISRERLMTKNTIIIDQSPEDYLSYEGSATNFQQREILLCVSNTSRQYSSLPEYIENYKVIDPKPEEIKKIRKDDHSLEFLSDGGNVSSIFNKMHSSTEKKVKIENYLHFINKDFDSISIEETKSGYILLNFSNKKNPNRFFETSSISDGTLRAFSILLAVFFYYGLNEYQSIRGEHSLQVGVGFEEPELNLHPSALMPILEAFRLVSDRVQIIVSTHSPDFLEQIEIKSGYETVLIVESVNGETVIDEIDPASLEAVNRKLFDLGELLRMQQLEPKSLVGRDR